ncbi:MAG: aspartate/glutamate racemase family protein [Candidatus Aminicenantes bacterium]|nr:aspartate/glutamate racemase family protein [Candidatus Aminicenantes bacterium]
MKTIGLVGGMTWHSTVDYYRLINEDVQRRLGGSSSARCVLYSVEFGEFEELQEAGDWDRLTALMVDAALRVETAGADLLVICANTMHRTADSVAAALAIPLIHIADAAAAEIRRSKVKTVGLLGTRYTMEQDFYRKRLETKHGLRVLVPDQGERTRVHDIIYTELGRGIIKESSKAEYLAIIDRLRGRGAEGVILGCTEIPLLVKPGDAPIPLYDTTALHAKAAVDAALDD